MDADRTESPLRTLLAKLRASVPHAPIVMIGWAIRRYDTVPEPLRQAAEEFGVDLVPVTNLAGELERHGLLRRSVLHHGHHVRSWGYQSSFARRGDDTVHPSPIAHLLIGSSVARFIASRLRDATCSATKATEPLLRVAPRQTEADAASTREQSISAWEMCWDTIAPGAPPFHSSSGEWSYVNDGVSKGISKLGLASMLPNDTLTLGPLPLPAAPSGTSGVSAAAVLVELGYLVSAKRKDGPHLHAFSVGCDGCDCMARASPYRFEQYPFPKVPTDARDHPDPTYARLNATVTATTSFIALVNTSTPCHVLLTHLRPPKPRRGVPPDLSPSRIRIDSLFVRALHMNEYVYQIAKIGSYTARRTLMHFANTTGFAYDYGRLEQVVVRDWAMPPSRWK